MSRSLLIIGGGPAGIMAALLFARAGVPVTVFEKHADFFRDFRGDTVHPSTMEILDQLGLLDIFLARPHSRIDSAQTRFGGKDYKLGDLSHLPTPAPFIAMMPQWEFLDFLRDEAMRYPHFTLHMEAKVAGLVEESGRVAGVQLDDGRIITDGGGLVIAADGRGSIVRDNAGLEAEILGAPMDILWFPIPKSADVQGGLRGVIGGGAMMVMIDRSDYWQCAYLIPKGSAEALKAEGIAAFRARIERLAPELAPLDTVLTDVAQLKLLSVALDRLTSWSKPGLLVIGDAAHTMSPIGGVGINLAIQDAVAAANILAGPMAQGAAIDPLLAKVQARRMLPTRLIHVGQRLAQNGVITPLLQGKGPTKAPWIVRLLDRYPLLQRIPGRMVGLGIRRERVESPEASASNPLPLAGGATQT